MTNAETFAHIVAEVKDGAKLMRGLSDPLRECATWEALGDGHKALCAALDALLSKATDEGDLETMAKIAKYGGLIQLATEYRSRSLRHLGVLLKEEDVYKL